MKLTRIFSFKNNFLSTIIISFLTISAVSLAIYNLFLPQLVITLPVMV